jgi:hypothetical protein
MLEGKRGQPMSSADIFGMFDQNRNGSISKDEFLNALTQTGLQLSDTQKILLLNTADLNKNNIIDYEEFTRFLLSFRDEPSVASFDASELYSVRMRPVSEIAALDTKKLQDFQPDTLDEALYKLKLYAKSSYGTMSAIENVFFKLDDEEEGFLSEAAFLLALERFKLGFTAK